MEHLKSGNCRSCGAAIVWLRAPSGKWMPTNAETVKDPKAEWFDYDTMTSHFATCLNPDAHRKPKEGKHD